MNIVTDRPSLQISSSSMFASLNSQQLVNLSFFQFALRFPPKRAGRSGKTLSIWQPLASSRLKVAFQHPEKVETKNHFHAKCREREEEEENGWEGGRGGAGGGGGGGGGGREGG